jgi:hypothetical protein
LAAVTLLRAPRADQISPLQVGHLDCPSTVYERGHVSAGEILRFGFWMTLVAYVAIVCVALPYWAAMGQPLVPGGLGTSG